MRALFTVNKRHELKSSSESHGLVLFSLAVFVILVIPQLGSWTHASSAASASASTQQQEVSVPMNPGESLKIIPASPSANITLLSVSGGAYNIGYSLVPSEQGELDFSPLDNSNYSISIGVAAPQSSSPVLVTLLVNSGIIIAWGKNVTSTGTLVILASVGASSSSLPSPASSSKNGWSPLFGFTGLSIRGFAFGGTNILAVLAAISVSIIALGAKFDRRGILYFGIFFLSIVGIAAVGILVVASVIAIYFGSFAIVRSYSSSKSLKGSGKSAQL